METQAQAIAHEIVELLGGDAKVARDDETNVIIEYHRNDVLVVINISHNA